MSMSVELARAARLRRHGGYFFKFIIFPVLMMLAAPAMVPSLPSPFRAWNFAFGSNMDVSTRRRRQLAPTEIRPAVAEGWELHFSLPGIPYIEPSFAALRPGSNVSTHGVCLELDRESWLRLLVSEGVLGPDEANGLKSEALQEILELAARPRDGFGYRLLPIEVGMYQSSSQQTAYAFVDAKAEAPPLLPPSQRYWRLLRNGARKHGLDRNYRDYLLSLPRYVPSLLSPAALPTLAASAISSMSTGDVGCVAQWPGLEGPAAVAKGRLEIGHHFPSAWSRFCTTPREKLLTSMRELIGKESSIVYVA